MYLSMHYCKMMLSDMTDNRGACATGALSRNRKMAGATMTANTPMNDRKHAQKQLVAHATLKVISRDGLDKTSMRAIAHEMDKTTGVLTHYFRDKESLLLFTIGAVSEGVTESLKPLFGNGLNPADFVDAFIRLVSYDEATDFYWRAWLALTTASMKGGPVHDAQARAYQAYRDAVTDRLEVLCSHGWLSPDLNIAEAAIKLIAFVDGIGIQSIISPDVLPPSARAKLVREYCNHLFMIDRESTNGGAGNTVQRANASAG
jgi:AcrR family transcriptional regulator